MRTIKYLTACMMVLLLVLLSGCGAGQTQQSAASPAEQAAEFFKGKTLRFVVNFGAGGGSDIYARTLQPYIEKYLPDTTVIVENVEGGGGSIGLNQIWDARKDGLTIGVSLGTSMAYSQISDIGGIKYNIGEWIYLARVSNDTPLVVTKSDSPINSIEDLVNLGRPAKVSFEAAGDDSFFTMAIESELAGYEIDPIIGYGGSNDCVLAVIAGEVDITEQSSSTLIASVDNGDVKPLSVVSVERDPRFPDVPTLLEVCSEENTEQVQALVNLFDVQRVLLTTPGVPQERVDLLREVMDKACNDPEFLTKMEQLQRPVQFLNGSEVQALMDKVSEEMQTFKPAMDAALSAINQ